MKYYHVDVFSNRKYSGNGLTIFPGSEKLDKSLMHTLTREMRQFESIFLQETGTNQFRAYIFTMEEELDFAGHPIIGAAALLHNLYASEKETNTWQFELNEKSTEVVTYKKGNYHSAKMNQGKPQFGKTLSAIEASPFLEGLQLTESDLYNNLPIQVVSTGLPYLIVPVKSSSLKNVKVTVTDLESKLIAIGAKFFFVMDIENKEGRTWDNLGLVEDIATGSAAGPAGAYLVEHGIEGANKEIILQQGRFLGRPSELRVTVTTKNNAIDDTFVEGDVVLIANGELI